ncbi:PEP-CTERM sorting domain-containing protein [Luteolibacter sp. SL250]|uniref:PEP-CTERM sorting domain-containing protein n=1 Tax=Luteolibacter sp. SL250 TaxID=2995170 RepID=UPI0022703019|nr:PEP-CTERM sorting domain-containing protein [Luteolibacter sp. SL250]WAC21242.1 PEP-CTERM sorting domain-containing protein [Luteolibacter sp. SL250]
MKISKLSQSLLRSGAVAALVFASSSAQRADAALHLAFGVDTNAGSPTTFNQIRVRDLHDDHYHGFTQNNGTAGSHVPEPFVVIPGSGMATLDLASMDISPFSSSRYTTTLTPGGDFHLELIGLTGIDTDNLIVRFWHDDHTHTMSVGGNAEHLSLAEINKIDFALASGAGLGSYSAQFRIVDEGETYITSPTFTIHVNAVPEPSAALLGAAALGFGILRRRRR